MIFQSLPANVFITEAALLYALIPSLARFAVVLTNPANRLYVSRASCFCAFDTPCKRLSRSMRSTASLNCAFVNLSLFFIILFMSPERMISSAVTCWSCFFLSSTFCLTIFEAALAPDFSFPASLSPTVWTPDWAF